MSKRFYLITAIDYVNGEPHLGHAYEKVITDIIARTHRSLGQEVCYLTGLDEHGQKVQTAAKADGKDPQAYCDDFAVVWERFAGRLHLTNADLVMRLNKVGALIMRLKKAGALIMRLNNRF